MLEIKKKKYEVEEKVQLRDEDDSLLYEFTMQITADELRRIKEIIFEDGEKLKKEYKMSDLIHRENLEKQIEEKIKEKSDEFENICFKEHKEPFKEKSGQFKYDELVDEMMGFFINFFVEKQLKPLNTSIMNLKSLMNK